jgi:hypothetical protein
LSPRRKEPILVDGRMFLQPDSGRLVRLQGQLAKSPSFWIKNVQIVQSYERLAGTVVPVVLASNAQVRFLGLATFRMTYVYSEIDGQPVTATSQTLTDGARPTDRTVGPQMRPLRIRKAESSGANP